MKWKILIAIAVIIAAVVAWILISPLFIEVKMEEEAEQGITMLSGTWQGADDAHRASGNVVVIESDEGKTLHFSEFSVTNGPDLRVYLATDTEATEFIDLGKNRATVGSVNYEIPPGTDLEKYDTVLIWCRAFSVLFGSAELQ